MYKCLYEDPSSVVDYCSAWLKQLGNSNGFRKEFCGCLITFHRTIAQKTHGEKLLLPVIFKEKRFRCLFEGQIGSRNVDLVLNYHITKEEAMSFCNPALLKQYLVSNRYCFSDKVSKMKIDDMLNSFSGCVFSDIINFQKLTSSQIGACVTPEQREAFEMIGSRVLTFGTPILKESYFSLNFNHFDPFKGKICSDFPGKKFHKIKDLACTYCPNEDKLFHYIQVCKEIPDMIEKMKNLCDLRLKTIKDYINFEKQQGIKEQK